MVASTRIVVGRLSLGIYLWKLKQASKETDMDIPAKPSLPDSCDITNKTVGRDGPLNAAPATRAVVCDSGVDCS